MERLYGNVNLVYLVLAGVSLALLASLGTLALRAPISEVKTGAADCWVAWGVICVGTTVVFFGRKYAAQLRGMNYIALVNRWDTLFGLLGVLVSASVLLTGKGIVALAAATQLFAVLGVIRGRLLLHHVEEQRFRAFRYFSFDRELFQAAWAPAWRTGIGILGSSGVVQATGIIYAQFVQASALVPYLLALKIMTAIAEVSKAPFYSKIPVFSRLRAEGNVSGLGRRAGSAMEISLFLFGVGVLIAGVLTTPLLATIGADATFVGRDVWVLMAIVWYLERHHGMHAQVYSTTNHIPFYVPILISGVINLALATLLVSSLGIWAFPIALGVSNAMINNWWNVKLSLESIDMRFWPFSRLYVWRATAFFAASCVVLMML
jgi:hypothetical protein